MDDLKKLTTILACPVCKSSLNYKNDEFICSKCNTKFKIKNNIINFVINSKKPKKEEIQWNQYWQIQEKERKLFEKFCSFYRKNFTARLVKHYTSKYFSKEGIFLEAGSGTSQTSIKISKHKRTFIALDIIPSVLEKVEPIMDLKISGDLFQLPFKNNSLDGIWNVGVMEHFSQKQIKKILSEFYRVLKRNSYLILLWPYKYSISILMLRLLEKFVSFASHKKIEFYPSAPSELKSKKQAYFILKNAGFRDVNTFSNFVVVIGKK